MIFRYKERSYNQQTNNKMEKLSKHENDIVIELPNGKIICIQLPREIVFTDDEIGEIVCEVLKSDELIAPTKSVSTKKGKKGSKRK